MIELLSRKQDSGYPGAIISRAIVNRVTGFIRSADTKMIPMGTHHDEFVLEIRSREDSADITCLLDVICDRHIHISFHLEREAAEARLLGRGNGCVQVNSGSLKKLASAIFMKPTLYRELVGIVRSRIVKSQVIFQMAVDADMPAVTGGFRVMKHKAAGSPTTLGLLELIEPPSIICHIVAPEKRGVIVAGIIDHGDDDLSFHVYSIIIIPPIFRSMDTEPAEDIFSFRDADLVRGSGGPHHHIVRIV